jgi:hypothetical protein
MWNGNGTHIVMCMYTKCIGRRWGHAQHAWIDNRSSLFVRNNFVLYWLVTNIVPSLAYEMPYWISEIICQCYAALT